MNEQLIVKNFGPIKDATVDFKRVTIFIGPTGGGKSTLAKLKDIFLYRRNYTVGETKKSSHPRFDSKIAYQEHGLLNFFSNNTFIDYKSFYIHINYKNGNHFIGITLDNIRNTKPIISKEQLIILNERVKEAIILQEKGLEFDKIQKEIVGELSEMIAELRDLQSGERTKRDFPTFVAPISPWYCTSERVFVPALEYSWAGLIRDDIGLPKLLLHFANSFLQAKKEVPELAIPFLNIKYLHQDGRDRIKIPGREEPLLLLETASGIQSVTPLLVLLEHLSRNTEQAQSFIIEEPELNLYPTAQRDLVYWLLEKCTQGDNDLTITTHSPYVLSALNLALYAGKVATLFPHQRQKVAKIIPEKYWLKAEEFSAYYVAGGGVKSIFDTKTGLLSESQLDEVSGHFADVFDRLTDLRVPEKKAPAKAKSARK
ncbi:AAA family ATPase [Hymenobacter cheonanensis]|uniref:AAA family ATPase n=1 Tax=Hymenobacter sp. CA2-7 TaxID=3063993 RepID=UPI0027123FC8|nr:AAA family ATPase [Hymenobacter sp. CA2-7]MDO7884499.1 AAA family ATPase [Hymenobacter sp. CA2-7]